MKKIIALLLALVMVVSIAACAPSKPEDTTGTTPKTPTSGTEDTKGTEGTVAPAESETPLVIQWDQANGTDRVEAPYVESSLSYHTLMMWPKMYYNDGSKDPAESEILDLLESYKHSEDGMALTLKIREDAVWSDGEPVTIDDLIFTINAMILDPVSSSASAWDLVVGYPELTAGEADTLEGVVRVDDYTLTLNLLFDASSWVPDFYVLPEHCFEDVAWSDLSVAPYWSAPVTCGPYKFVEATFPDYMKLTRDPLYYGEPAGIKNVTAVSYEASTGDAAVAAMIAGTDHITTRTVTTSGIIANEIAKGNPDCVIKSMYSDNLRCLTFNAGDRSDGKNKDVLVNDPNARLAISLLIDEDTIGAYVAGVPCKVVGNPLNEVTTHEFDNVNKSLDLERAKKLLDEAGWNYDDVIDILCYYTDQVSKDALTIIQTDAAKIGVQININIVTENLGVAIYDDKNWDLMFYQAGGSMYNPAAGIMQLRPGSDYNWLEKQPAVGEKYGKLYDAACACEAEGTPEWIAIQHEMQKANFEDNWIIPIYVNSTVMVYNAAKIYVPETAFDHYDNVLDLHLWKMLD